MVASLTFAALAVLSILPVSAADSDPTVTLYLPYAGVGGQIGPLLAMSNLEASIISADSTARTYDLKCASTRLCSLPVPFTLTQGIDLIQYTATNPDTRASGTTSLTCTYTSTSGACEATIVDAGGAYGGGGSNGLYQGVYDNLPPVTATVTAGQSLLSQSLQPAFSGSGSGSSRVAAVTGSAKTSGSVTARSSSGHAPGAPRETARAAMVGGAVAGVAAVAMAF